jgi:hypothetical protein
MIKLYDNWLESSTKANIKHVTDIYQLHLKRHHAHFKRDIDTDNKWKTWKPKWQIQSQFYLKARGFLNFDRFEINIMCSILVVYTTTKICKALFSNIPKFGNLFLGVLCVKKSESKLTVRRVLSSQNELSPSTYSIQVK